MIYKVNKALLPCIFNSDYTCESLTTEDVYNIESFPVDLSSFSIFELDNGEWLTDFTFCDICKSLCQCVILYNKVEDIEVIKSEYLFGDQLVN